MTLNLTTLSLMKLNSATLTLMTFNMIPVIIDSKKAIVSIRKLSI